MVEISGTLRLRSGQVSLVGSESVVIDSVLGFSQGVRVGFISSPEDGIELILMRRKIVSLSAGRLSDQGILGNPASVFHPLK